MENLSPVLYRLKEVALAIDNLKHVKAHLEVVNENLLQHYKKLKELDNAVSKGEKQLDRLENKTLTSVFRNIVGDKDKQLDQKRREYLEASLEYNDSKSSVELLEFEKNILEKKIRELPELLEEIKSLKKKRENEILKMGSTILKDKLTHVLKSMDQNILHTNEYTEAIAAGEKALQELHYVIHHLKKAKDWGQMDMMNSGRSNSKRAKYQSIDRAKSYVPNAQHRINIFRREIMDVGIDSDQLTINMEELKTFSNIFFNNIISDFLFQQKLVKTLKSVSGVDEAIKRVVVYLEIEHKSLQEAYQELIIRKDEILYSE